MGERKRERGWEGASESERVGEREWESERGGRERVLVYTSLHSKT